MGKHNVPDRLRGLRPCGCTDSRPCEQHWQAMTREQQREWQRQERIRRGRDVASQA